MFKTADYTSQLTTYSESMKRMDEAHQMALLDGEESLLAFEYRPVITLGKRLKEQRESLEVQYPNLPVVITERGGEITFHNPGQLVVYPIVNLSKRNIGVRDFVCLLERTTKEALASLQITCHSVEGAPGLYTSKGKIMSIGLRVKRGISTHGIAVNISNDFSDFVHLACCGVNRPRFDRVADSASCSLQAFFALWKKCFFTHMEGYK